MSLRWAIPGELLSSIARFRFARRSHPKPKTPVRLLKNSERLQSQKSTVSRTGFIAQGVCLPVAIVQNNAKMPRRREFPRNSARGACRKERKEGEDYALRLGLVHLLPAPKEGGACDQPASD